ncbi:Aldose 1-epimerase [Grifola frondosa]|uniref:Aldose 1-epimerase n=1 Tax=Grifola frondosa TaxID=5627 RepID=A0A1C7LN57_GRIFR|nr:Aldose 1-epimerase [Grifola frondosa]
MAAPVDPSFAPLLLALPSFTPSLALEVLPAGLTIHRLFVQADAKVRPSPPHPFPMLTPQTHDILIGPEDPAGHLTQRYTNTIIGRYANRLPVGSFPISRNGLSATVTPLSNESDTVSLHGGRRGFDDYTWEPLADPSAAELFTKAEADTIQARVPSSAVFTRVSEDGEEGFPGRLRVEVLVGLLQPEGAPTLTQKEWNLGSVLLVYRAKLLDPGKVTPINLTQHWGFNLDASLQESLSVQDHKISIAADNTIALTPEKLSAGSLAPVTSTAHAHAKKPDGRIGAHAYDEFYLFSAARREHAFADARTRVRVHTHAGPRAGCARGAEEVVRLEGARSGLRVGFTTNRAYHFPSSPSYPRSPACISAGVRRIGRTVLH